VNGLTPILERKEITCHRALNATRRLPSVAVSHGRNFLSFLVDAAIIVALGWIEVYY
jgi:hypothetical protein